MWLWHDLLSSVQQLSRGEAKRTSSRVCGQIRGSRVTWSLSTCKQRGLTEPCCCSAASQWRCCPRQVTCSATSPCIAGESLRLLAHHIGTNSPATGRCNPDLYALTSYKAQTHDGTMSVLKRMNKQTEHHADSWRHKHPLGGTDKRSSTSQQHHTTKPDPTRRGQPRSPSPLPLTSYSSSTDGRSHAAHRVSTMTTAMKRAASEVATEAEAAALGEMMTANLPLTTMLPVSLP